jgi:hypothetical protein
MDNAQKHNIVVVTVTVEVVVLLLTITMVNICKMIAKIFQ